MRAVARGGAGQSDLAQETHAGPAAPTDGVGSVPMVCASRSY